MIRICIATLCVLTCMLGLAGEANPPRQVDFTAKPAVKKTGDTFKITFDVSAPTDVAVYIEDAQGEVVRHLVAGVLGANPPAPLKPGLAQEIEWDGKADYGKPAEGGPFKVRVGLGLGAKYDRVAFSGLTQLLEARAIAVAPDGSIYVRVHEWGWTGSHWQICGRDGTFQAMWGIPPGADAARYFGWAFADGRPDPMDYNAGGRNVNASMVFGAVPGAPGSSAAVVSRDGNDLFQIGNTSPLSIYRYPLTATCPKDDKFRVNLDGSGATGVHADALRGSHGCLAVSPDGKTLYVGGLTSGSKNARKPLAAVWAVKCPERTDCRVLFGDPATAGSDEQSLGGAPSGLAVDGKRRLFIVDGANNRVVVVSEKDGKYLGEIATDQPTKVGVSTRTGAIYVLGMTGRRTTSLRRFSPPTGSDPREWKDLKPEAVMLTGGVSDYLAVDDSSAPTVIWRSGGFGTIDYQRMTVRTEDSGSGPKFGETARFPAGKGPAHRDQVQCGNVQVDRLRKEVYFRNGNNGIYQGRFVEKTGTVERFALQYPGYMQAGGTGLQMVPAPDGNLYGISWPVHLYRYDRNGKKLDWQEPAYNDPLWVEKVDVFRQKGTEHDKGPGAAYVPVSMSMLPHMLGVRWSDGNIFVLHPRTHAVNGARTLKAMHEYLPSGREVTAPDNFTIWKVSDSATGPKFDAAGNIYIAEAVRPKGWVVPQELADYYTGKGVSLETQGGKYVNPLGCAAGLYGSILKFTPKGGMVHCDKKGDFGGNDPFVGEPKLDPSLKTVDVDYVSEYLLRRPTKVTGAEWIHPGMGHIGVYRCNCESVTFDVDEFGRVFFPDTPLFKVRVIDTAGNALASFGGYGGPNSMGPESPVVDPGTNRLRPRRADDPKDLKSPFASPDLGFQWLVGIGVTDRYAYFGDSLNQRLLRANLVYAAEASCALP